MRFVDRAVLRLLGAEELDALLTDAVGRALLDAAYVFDNLAVGDVSDVQARVSIVTPEVVGARQVSIVAREATSAREWQWTGELGERTDAGVHALLDVTVTAASRGVVTEVTDVEVEDLAGLRSALAAAADFDAALAAVSARMPQSESAGLAEALRRRGVTDLDSLRASFASPREPSRLVVTLVSDATTAPSPRAFRMTVLARAIDELATGLVDAVAAFAHGRRGVGHLLDPPLEPRGARLRVDFPALLLFPVAALDDVDLPLVAGQNPANDTQRRASRLAELTTRLRAAGIVPLAV